MKSSIFWSDTMNYKLTKKQAKEMLENKLLHFFGVSTHNATNEQYYRAIAMILRDMMTEGRGETVKKSDETGKNVSGFIHSPLI